MAKRVQIKLTTRETFEVKLVQNQWDQQYKMEKKETIRNQRNKTWKDAMIIVFVTVMYVYLHLVQDITTLS